jgi:hypothetical protein
MRPASLAGRWPTDDGHPKEIYRPINPDGSLGEGWSLHYRML